MITADRALQTLKRFDIDEEQILDWETALEIEIPVDEFGNKVYTPLHINLFKNIKKHVVLGRSLQDIRQLVVLPSSGARKETQIVAAEPTEMIEIERERVQSQTAEIREAINEELHQKLLKQLKPITPTITPRSEDGEDSNIVSINPNTNRVLKRFANPPISLNNKEQVETVGPNASLLILIERLMSEKDELQGKLVDVEKQKTHLLKATEIANTQVKELADQLGQLSGQLQAHQSFKLIDDKSRLQKQLIELDGLRTQLEKRLQRAETEARQLQESLANKVEPNTFVGNWLEEAELKEIVFDNFGINIESKRNRMFRVTYAPERVFGHTGIIETTYDYQTNTLWKRTETLIVSIINENYLEGELIAEYTLDGSAVAKAIYRVTCHRNGSKIAIAS